MTLSDLKTRGTKLSDVEPGFQGMGMREWWRKMLTSECDAYVEKQDKTDAPLNNQRLWNKRDSYGKW